MIRQRLACSILLLVSMFAGVPVWAEPSPDSAPASANAGPTDAAPTAARKIQGGVSVNVNPFRHCINDLIETAHERDSDISRFQAAANWYGSPAGKVRDRATDVLNYTLMYRGISISSEAGDVILDEKHKLKSLASALYLKQKKADDIDLRVITDVFQLASEIGAGTGKKASPRSEEAWADLIKLVGSERAESTIASLKGMQAADWQDSPAITPDWSVSDRQKRIQQAAQSAASRDTITSDLQNDVHRYNKHIPGSLAAHRTIRVALSTASMSPSFVGPAAQALMFGFLFTTGGTEEHKLLTELYLDKRLASRAHLLTEEAHLAVDNFELATMTHNKLLLMCSEQLLKKMSGKEEAAKMLSTDKITERVKPGTTDSAVINQ